MAELQRSERYRSAAAGLKIGIVLLLAGTYALIVGLITEPVYPDFTLLDVLLIIPLIVKIILAELSGTGLIVISILVLFIGVTLIVFGAAGIHKYRDDPAQMVPQTEAELQRALDELDRQLACGEITKEQYYRKQQSVLWRR